MAIRPVATKNDVSQTAFSRRQNWHQRNTIAQQQGNFVHGLNTQKHFHDSIPYITEKLYQSKSTYQLTLEKLNQHTF